MRALAAALAGGLAPVLAGGPAAACGLALLLALDVSASVDAREDRLQRDGLAAALTAPEVAAAILADPEAPVALAVYEWSGVRQQDLVMGWRLIDGPEALEAAAAAIAGSVRVESEFPTAIGYAIGHAATLFRAAPACRRQVLDITADGLSNDGFPPRLAYRHFPLEGITVNALAIGGQTDLASLVPYLLAEVIRGPAAFVETADGYGDFERAMRRKLLREIAPPVFGALR